MKSIIYKRTDSSDVDFISLTRELDEFLDNKFPGTRGFFGPLNKIPEKSKVIIACIGSVPAACGCLKQYDEHHYELKRMFVRPEFRGRGLGRSVLAELETWAGELGAANIILETGKELVSAVSLYRTSGFEIIQNYGEYEDVETSVCMKKVLK